MFVGYVFIIICCCVLSSNCQHTINTLCEGSSCYYLYKGNTSYLTWSQSLEACNNEGLEMARIESSQTQKVIQRIIQDLPQNTQRQIWIGGRRSTDDKWRYMNGSEFNKQYSCISSDSHFGDKCYRKTKYDEHEPNRIDWYNGETYCSQSDIQGDIAYSYLDDHTLINDIINFVDDSKVCVHLWFGVRKRIWFWMTGSNINGDKQPINYFNWDNNTKIDSSDDDCIYIDRDKGNKWFTRRCTGPPLKYCICMNINIILIIITVISVTGVIILVVYCIHLRRRIQSLTYEEKRSNSRNNDVTTGTGILETPGLSTSNDVTQISTQIQQDIQDIQYEVIDGGREKRQDTEMAPDFVNIQRDTESDPYEKPSTYMNMVDRPNVYQSLNNN
ncbi:hypothetical protein LSH36_1945g00003 [Paralvinella palmiformis]|uniref:C-type lectin domain-containing protein n=1 Tax=Paralvinella palmiformis TaxID=53620 RepID=A0AAD9IRG5_9ANNE|nr:hypothetical protein LSH36_1945g00003 [Paralvinella palmiformis]